MKVTQAIKTMMLYKNKKHIEVAESLDYTKQGFSNLLKKDNYKIVDLEKIADILEYDVKITLKDRTGNNDIIIQQ